MGLRINNLFALKANNQLLSADADIRYACKLLQGLSLRRRCQRRRAKFLEGGRRDF